MGRRSCSRNEKANLQPLRDRRRPHRSTSGLGRGWIQRSCFQSADSPKPEGPSEFSPGAFGATKTIPEQMILLANIPFSSILQTGLNAVQSGSNPLREAGQALCFGGRRAFLSMNRFAGFLNEYCAEWLRRSGFIPRSTRSTLDRAVFLFCWVGLLRLTDCQSLAQGQGVTRATRWPGYSWPGRHARRTGISRRSTFARGCSSRASRGLTPNEDSASSHR